MMLRLGWCSDVDDRALKHDVTAKSSQHLGHQRDVENVGAIGDGARALGQQGCRHQFEDTVLRTAHRYLADEAVPTGYQKAFTHSSIA